MSRSKKYPVITDKNPWVKKLTYSKVFRKDTRRYIQSHLNDIIGVVYMVEMPIEKEYSHQYRFHVYKINYSTDACGTQKRCYRSCPKWDYVPLYLRDEVCNDCRKFFSRK